MSAGPRFTKRFRRLCQVAAVAGTARTQEVIDGLLPVAVVYGNGPWRDAADWVDAVEELFDLRLPEADVVAGLRRGIDAGVVVYHANRQEYRLRPDVLESTRKRIDEGDSLEREARQSWLSQVEHAVPGLTTDQLWTCLMNYAGKAFLAHGADAVELLGGDPSRIMEGSSDDTPEALLRKSMEEVGVDPDLSDSVSIAVSMFFDGSEPCRVSYIGELVNSTFNFLALGLDADVRIALTKHLPALTIFVDTNVIYGMIGAHSNPQSATSAELARLLDENSFPFQLYYHEKTLRELENTLYAIGSRLRRRQWSSQLSRAILNSPVMSSGIETRYHEINSRVPTSVDVFLSKYANLPALLSEYGLAIFRQSGGSADSEMRSRAELTAEYQVFADARRRGDRKRTYEGLDHDVQIWLAAWSRRTPRRGGPLFSGSLVLTADHLFLRFDREVLADEYAQGRWMVTTPDTLLRALRPFLTSTANLSDVAFTRIFASPELRSIGSNQEQALARVAAYLATYSDISEATATRLLADSMLMTRLRDVEEGSSDFSRIMEEALILENETLLREREDLRKEAAESRASLEVAVNSIRSDLTSLSDDVDSPVAKRLNQIEAQLEQLSKQAPNFRIEGGTVIMSSDGDVYSGGYYNNERSQIAGQGPGAQAHNVVQQADQRTLSVDMEQLGQQLESVKQNLIQSANSTSDYQAVAEIQAAKEAAEANDEGAAHGHLAKAGKWALEAATKIGASVAEIALKKALGLEE